MFYGLNQLLGVPLQARELHIGVEAAILGSAAIGAGSSLLGGLFGSSNNSSTNKTNLKIAQMNNEFNERMLDKQMAYNTDMWNKQNEYNTAENQVKRFQEAGINPYLAMSNGNAGIAQSANGVNPPTASPVQVQSYDPSDSFTAAGNMIANSIMQYAQVKKLDAETQQVNTQTAWIDKAMEAQVAQMLGQTDYNKALSKRALQDFMFNDQKNPVELQSMHLQNRAVEAQIALTDLQSALTSKQLSYYDAEAQARIANIVADTRLKIATKQLTEKQAITEVKKALLVEAQTSGQEISNDVAERSADYLVSESRGRSYDANTNYRVGTGEQDSFWQKFTDAATFLGRNLGIRLK